MKRNLIGNYIPEVLLGEQDENKGVLVCVVMNRLLGTFPMQLLSSFCFHVFPSNSSEHVVAKGAVVGAVEADVEVEKKEVK